MAGSKADYLEAALLNEVLGGTNYAPAANTYTALYTVAPTDAGGGTEVTGGSYARVAKTNDGTNWPAATGTSPTTKQNGTAHTFPTASASWGTVVAFAILDNSTGGNFLYWGDLTTSKSIDNGDTAEFAINAITITED